MKETGLMFKAPLVRAILSGQKTQTRRVVKWRDLAPGLNLGFSGLKVFSNTLNTFTLESQARAGWESRSSPTRCPMGQPSDRIYVRETVRSCRAYEVQGYPPSEWGNKPLWFEADGTPPGRPIEWAINATPAIHMPKWAARTWLEINDVRVERLQAISVGDAEAEGVDFLRSVPDADETLSAKQLFECLWDSTGGDWDTNPWVWVIDFKRIEKP